MAKSFDWSTLPDCDPPAWAQGGHPQTILGHLLPSPALSDAFQDELIPLADGDKLAVRVHERAHAKATVYLFHGLAGDAEADYMQRAARVCLDLGHAVVRVNHRGCGHGAGLARGIYHSGRSDDVSSVVGWGKQRNPDRRHLALGFSLSGNALLRLLSGGPGEILPDAAIAVNAPIDLASCSVLLQRGLNRIYDARFVLKLRADLARRRSANLLSADYRVPVHATLRDFDAIYTGPASGFGTRENYYAECSTWDRLDRIQVPTVILAAKDDPFVGYEAYARAKFSPSVTFHSQEHGGHMGYLTRARTPLGSRRWLDYAISCYLRALI